jgi:hypothetical protein
MGTIKPEHTLIQPRASTPHTVGAAPSPRRLVHALNKTINRWLPSISKYDLGHLGRADTREWR